VERQEVELLTSWTVEPEAAEARDLPSLLAPINLNPDILFTESAMRPHDQTFADAELSGMAPIVRPVGNKPEIIAPFLDRGAWGVQVPHVNTADEARAAVDAVKYAPEGHRGIFSDARAQT
jgi:HpcH/HpaI aldolase/citrate lyase family